MEFSGFIAILNQDEGMGSGGNLDGIQLVIIRWVIYGRRCHATTTLTTTRK